MMIQENLLNLKKIINELMIILKYNLIKQFNIFNELEKE